MKAIGIGRGPGKSRSAENMLKKIAGRSLLVLIVLSSCVGCDQLSKAAARRSLAGVGTVSFLSDFFRLQYAENPGAFLSLGANTSEGFKYWVFIILVGLTLAGVLAFLLASKTLSKAHTAALSLLLAGGVGNLIDRICNDGRVIDFLNLGIGSLRTGVFNVADIAISAGSAWLLILSIKKPERIL